MLEQKFYVFIIATLSPVIFLYTETSIHCVFLIFELLVFVKCTAEDKLGILMVADLGVMFFLLNHVC